MHQSRSVKLELSRFLPFEIAYTDEGGWEVRALAFELSAAFVCKELSSHSFKQTVAAAHPCCVGTRHIY